MLRLANHGETMVEIAEQLDLPPELGDRWCNRSYYGSINHNAKAVYNLYLGWFDGNPSTLHPLPPVESSIRYVEYMGGADAVVGRARGDVESGDYRWAAQVLNHVVFADPTHTEARELLAQVLDQLGFQTENGVWRNFYLTGAQELRHGVLDLGPRSGVAADTLAAMPVSMLLDYLAVRLNGPAAQGLHVCINLDLTDPAEQRVLELRRSVLHHHADRQRADAHATLQTSVAVFKDVISSNSTLSEQIELGRAGVVGDPDAFPTLVGRPRRLPHLVPHRRALTGSGRARVLPAGLRPGGGLRWWSRPSPPRRCCCRSRP